LQIYPKYNTMITFLKHQYNKINKYFSNWYKNSNTEWVKKLQIYQKYNTIISFLKHQYEQN